VRTSTGIARPSANFAELVFETASFAGAKPAIVEGGREWSYDWLVGRAHAFAQTLDAAGMEARVGSISFVAALDPAAREGVLAGARELAGDGVATLPYRSEVHVARRL